MKDILDFVDPLMMARALASADSIQQADFFRAFANQLFHECRNDFNTEMQIHHIQYELDERTKKWLGWGDK